MNLDKVHVRDFDPKKDINPVFHIKIGKTTSRVYLLDLRNLFRKWLDTCGSLWLDGQTNQSTVITFLSFRKIEMSKSDQKKLIIAFTTDITRKRLGYPYGQLTGELLNKWNNYESNK